jgi:two-component system chemotaxis response regulator CheY
MRILIADDQKTVGNCLAELVTQCNHDVLEVVTSGLDAINAYKRLEPDVVLMDYSMPRLNGATACRNILARDPNARIILVSGTIRSTDIAESGAVAVLPKPLHLSELYEALYSAGTRPPVKVATAPLETAA